MKPHVAPSAQPSPQMGRVESPVDWLYPDPDVRCAHCSRRIGGDTTMGRVTATGELVCQSCGCTVQDQADEPRPVDASAIPACERDEDEDGAPDPRAPWTTTFCPVPWDLFDSPTGSHWLIKDYSGHVVIGPCFDSSAEGTPREVGERIVEVINACFKPSAESAEWLTLGDFAHSREDSAQGEVA